MSKTIPILDRRGNVNVYVPFSERISLFLDKFSIEDGYSVVVDATGYLDTSPALLSLYKETIATHKNPSDVGLPALKELAIFTARLLKDGQPIQSASSCKLIINYKDWEIGETAARQRLAASLGFGSEDFLSDELADAHAQKLTLITNTDSETDSEVFLKSTIKNIDKPITKVSQIAPKTPEPNSVNSESIEHNSHINVQLIRRIYARAKPKNIDVPQFKNETEA